MKVNEILGCIHRDKDVLLRPGVQRPALVPTIYKRHGQTGEHPKAGHEDDWRAGEPPLWGKTDGVETFNFEKSWLRHNIITVFQYLKGHLEKGWRLFLHRESQGKDKEQWGQVAQREVLSHHKKWTFYSERNQPLEQAPQGCCWVHITGGFQDMTVWCARWSHLGSLFHWDWNSKIGSGDLSRSFPTWAILLLFHMALPQSLTGVI